MKPEQFIREYGVIRAKELINDPLHPKMTHVSDDGRHWVNENNKNLDENIRKQLPSLMRLEDLKRLVESLDLVNNCGGLAIANKITFQKRLRNEKATHFIQHPENQKLIQLLGRNQRKPKEAIKFDLFEQAIRDHESIYGGGDES